MEPETHFPEYAAEVALLREQSLGAARGQTVFYGSSSIRMWPGLDRAFPRISIVNLGFGGSTVAACAAYFQRLVVPLKPASLVFFAGDNDLAFGATPEAVWRSLVDLLDQRDNLLGPIPFVCLAIKPSPARESLQEATTKTNEWLQRELWSRENTVWVDTYSAMLDEQGAPDPQFFAKDELHLSRAGYQVWTELLSREAATLLRPNS